MFKPLQKQLDQTQLYAYFLENIQGYIHFSENPLTNLANFAAIVKYFFDDVNWAGFYLFDGKKLYLGPFQGLPACTTIELGKGVCGTAAQSRKTIVVPDTHQFAGHIVCDEASLSEIVIPIIKNDQLYGVLDLDSPILNRFNESDQKILEKAIHVLIDNLR
jgi:GAF domain-containing protein